MFKFINVYATFTVTSMLYMRVTVLYVQEVHMVTVVLAAIIHLAEIVFEEDSETNGVFITNEHSLEHG